MRNSKITDLKSLKHVVKLCVKQTTAERFQKIVKHLPQMKCCDYMQTSKKVKLDRIYFTVDCYHSLYKHIHQELISLNP